MLIFFIPILILIGIFAISVGGDILQNIDIPLPGLQLSFKDTSQKAAPKVVSSPKPSIIKQAYSGLSPPFSLNTIITKGPTEATEISDTNIVSFEFEGFVDPADTTGRITFETKIEGADSDWKATSSRQQTITLPVGQNEYVFLVRAKLGETIDATPAQRTFNITVSPFFGKVDITNARASDATRSSIITLKPRIAANETLDITGWKIQGINGSFTIPLGIEKFEPGIHDNPVNPIILKRDDSVKFSSEKSPFGIGRNFRPNICMGYLKNNYDFDLSFSASCSFQKPIRRELLSLSQQCENFILQKINFSNCIVPQYPENPNILIEGTAECAAYLQENFTYSSCFKKYQNDTNFTKNEWHIYMNTDFINPRYDFLKLYDANGLLVDTRELL